MTPFSPSRPKPLPMVAKRSRREMERMTISFFVLTWYLVKNEFIRAEQHLRVLRPALRIGFQISEARVDLFLHRLAIIHDAISLSDAIEIIGCGFLQTFGERGGALGQKSA